MSSPHTSIGARCAAMSVLLGFAMLGCDSGTPAARQRATSGERTSAVTSSSTAPLASSSTPRSLPRNPYAGAWRGKYKATQASVTVPKGVAYKWWEGDDGASASGDGQIELTVAEDGSVAGTSSGALGNLTIRGMVEEDVLRAGVTPTDQASEASMTGVLVGTVTEKSIEAQLRVSSHDAALVRRSAVRLTRK